MKINTKKFLILIPLIFIAGASFAAYTFVGPTAAPAGNNTDGPLDIGATDQAKNGGLFVNSFQSRTGSYFPAAQNVYFTGLVRGGTATDSNSTINVGTTANAASIIQTGNATVAGLFQANSLKSGGGNKPLCADAKGVVSICGSGGTTTPPPPTTIYIYPIFENIAGGWFAGADISQPVNTNVTVTISADAPAGGLSVINRLKNAFTAEAVTTGGTTCRYTATPTVIGTVTINQDSSVSWDTVPLSSGCNSSNTELHVSSYSPTSVGGNPLKASQ